jgi:hypothetical protein
MPTDTDELLLMIGQAEAIIQSLKDKLASKDAPKEPKEKEGAGKEPKEPPGGPLSTPPDSDSDSSDDDSSDNEDDVVSEDHVFAKWAKVSRQPQKKASK